MYRSVLLCAAVTAVVGCSRTTTAATNPQCMGVRSLVVAPASTTLVMGDTVRLSAKYAGPVCNGATPTAPWSWRSIDPEVATVDSTTGLVTARTTGSTSITASDAGGDAVGAMQLQVTQP